MCAVADRIVTRSSAAASPNGGALTWRITEGGAGAAAITVGLRDRIPGCDFPHLTGVVLEAPVAGAVGDDWIAVDHLRGEAGGDGQMQVMAPLLLVPVPRLVNLTVGQEQTRPLPIAAGAVTALAFGSLTNRLWVENDRHHLWLVDLDLGPALGDWSAQLGTDPLVRRGRLVVDPDGIRVDPIDEVRLSRS
jgi:hypothetical protein